MLRYVRRHSKDCSRKGRCNCPFQLTGSVNGRRYRESLQTGSPELARRRAQQRELEILLGKENRPVTVGEAVKAHAADIDRQGLAQTTRKKYGRLHTQLLQALGGSRELATIRPEDLRQKVLANWTQGPLTQRKALERLRAFFNFCLESDWINRSPAKGIKGPKVPPSRPHPLTREEITALLVACDRFGQEHSQRARMKALLILMRFSGLSIGDAVRLPIAAVQDDTIFTTRKKTGEIVRIPVPPVVSEALRNFPQASEQYFFWTGLGDPDGVARTYARRVQRVFKLAGVEGSSKRFRQTVATEYAKAGIDKAQHVMGHASVKTTERHYVAWTRERQQSLQSAAALAFGDEPEALAGAIGSSLTHGKEPRVN